MPVNPKTRVVHFEKEDVFRTLYYSGVQQTPSTPNAPHTPHTPHTPPIPNSPNPPTPPKKPVWINPPTKPPGFQPNWPTPVFKPPQTISIAAKVAPDPFETAIFPEWIALFMPFELGKQARDRFNLLKKLHPTWSTEKILSVIFGDE